MSERVENLIAQENAEIIRMLTDDEAIYIEAIFELDNEGKRVYDWEMMEVIFRQRMETLIDLNKQKEKGRRELENQMLKMILEQWEKNKNE